MLLSEGQMSDYKGAALMLDAIPKAEALLGDRGYDADWFREALTARGILACIPSKTNRKVPIPHDAALYRHRHNLHRPINDVVQANARFHALQSGLYYRAGRRCRWCAVARATSIQSSQPGMCRHCGAGCW